MAWGSDCIIIIVLSSFLAFYKRSTTSQPQREPCAPVAPAHLSSFASQWPRGQLPLPLHSPISPNQPALRRIAEWPDFSSIHLTSANPSFLRPKSWDLTLATLVTSGRLIFVGAFFPETTQASAAEKLWAALDRSADAPRHLVLTLCSTPMMMLSVASWLRLSIDWSRC